MAASDDEFEVECEEIYVSESEEVDPLELSFEAGASTTKKNTEKLVPLRGISLDMLPDATKLKYIRRPTRPVRLFSFSDRDVLNKFSNTNEASKTLAMHLLDIVKSVNIRRPVKIENGAVVPNFYIMATQCEPKEGEKVKRLDSSDIVNLVKDIIHMIKIGIYRRVDFVDIICDSPAIFMIKHIHVKHWDQSMNAVYVVTSEYLLPYLCKIRAAEEEEKSQKRKSSMVQRDQRTKGETPSKRRKTKREKEEVKLNVCSETHLNTVEKILKKYLEPEAVQFFLIQMKLSGKKSNHYRWKDEDKLLALNILRNNPTEYSLLFDKYSLPSDRTLETFIGKVKNNKELEKLVKPVKR